MDDAEGERVFSGHLEGGACILGSSGQGKRPVLAIPGGGSVGFRPHQQG